MADYWVSNDRKFCDFCKCWITDNKASVSFHETGKRHKAAVAQRISEISRNSTKAEKEKLKMEQDIRHMNEAALRSYSRDISSMGDMTARTINAVINSTMVETKRPSFAQSQTSTSQSTSRSGGQIDPLRLPGNSDDEDESKRPLVRKTAPTEETDASSLWIEAKTDDDNTYYWNVKTNESVWEPPKEGFMPLNEYHKINEIAVAQQNMKLANEMQSFRANVDEEVARYNREKLKNICRPDSQKAVVEKEKVRETFLTQEDADSPAMGSWQPVIYTEQKEIDWELPIVNKYIPCVVSTSQRSNEPPTKRFKEKTMTPSLIQDPTIPTSFKKRKIQRGNARQRIITEEEDD